MMSFYQTNVLLWAAQQSPATGLAIFGAGLLFGLYGVRSARLMLSLSGGLVGYFAAAAGASALGVQPDVLGLGGATAVFLGTLRAPFFGQLLCGAVTCGVIGAYFLDRFGWPGLPALVAGGLCGAIGLTMSAVCQRAMRILLTSLHGAFLMVLGAQAIATALMPMIGNTFRQWSAHNVLVLPVVMGMLTTMCYSVQSTVAQGDICSGPLSDGARHVSVPPGRAPRYSAGPVRRA